ncbi:hypothetical protein [Faecalibacter macacae]|uniref:Uncharacterized protein n=1 Tax=Faecalibacter macacae TaxID=1859289 RepID=A0A3L9MAX3_9FLAO|nr:hypothetical protein [Faecalibacter macacae]RLZ09723.1 hypothetical protein EAH69_08015 [Faecalibacter macacae]
MKKEKISLAAASWCNRKIQNPYELIQAIFEFKSLTTIKTNFNQILKYAFDKKFEIYTSPIESLKILNVLKSLTRASFKILRNIDQYERKSESNAVLHSKYLVYASGLTYVHYLNPYLLIKEVFKEQTLSQIEFDLQDILEHALGNASSSPSEDVCISFININRLLDACWLIFKREIYDEDV